ncbi:hypothetical protein P8452_66446 [Trifolium repens]|nr:hypothetical protein P8452_66446 [Trifolium repens]
MISSKCAKIVVYYRLITLEFQVKCSRKPPPAPVPPNTTSTAVNTIILPSYVATVICPLSIWENACVNGMKSSVELSNFSIYLKFNEVFVKGTVRYLVIPRIFGLKFHFTLRDGLSAWIAYTHKNLLSLASGVEKENGIEYQSFLKGSFIPLISVFVNSSGVHAGHYYGYIQVQHSQISESERVIHRFVDIIRRSTFKAKESSVQQKSGGSSSNLADASHFYILNVEC